MRTLNTVMAATLLLCPGLLAAMVLEGNAITGLPPNTVIELNLGPLGSETATTNDRGEVTITDEEDDGDMRTLFVPKGGRRVHDLTVLKTGRHLGSIGYVDGKLSVSTEAAARLSAIEVGRFEKTRERFTAALDYTFSEILSLEDIERNVGNGAAQATADGFDVRTSADDDTSGWGLGLALTMAADGKPLYRRGSYQWRARVGHSRYKAIKGEFTGSVPGLTLRSAGQQKINVSTASAGIEYFLVNRLGVAVDVGYAWYDLQDSGTIVRLEDGALLASFKESRSDGTPTLGAGITYYLSDHIGVGLRCSLGLDEVGASQDERPSGCGFNLAVLLGF